MDMVVFVGSSRRGDGLPSSLRIPQQFVPGFVVIAGLSESSYAGLVDAAKAIPVPFGTVRELQAWLASEVKSVPPNDIRKILSSISSLSKLLSTPKWTRETLATALDEAARNGIENFKVAEGADFKERVITLLSLDALNPIEKKAKELQQEAQRLLLDARILTDLRPVFGEDIGENPTAFILTHTLKLHYHESGKHREFFVALDEQDIASLKKMSERAQKKTVVLKRIVAASGIRSIDPDGGNIND
jgi:hypothetical protein